jgi:Domain of unknown function (DUF1893)
MLIPDFTQYSLALFEGENMIHSRCDGGIRPLWEALEMFRGKPGLVLHDKVTGLAAARLVVHSGIVSEIFTMVASLPAYQFLEKNNISLKAFDVAANILTKDKTGICPGEVIALETDDLNIFLQKIQNMMSRPVNVLTEQ